MTLPTKLPAYSSLHREQVYQPSEDSFLLMDAVDLCINTTKPQLIVECGVGSGVVSAHLATRYPRAQILSVDLSPFACQTAQDTLLKLNKLHSRATVARMNFLDNLRPTAQCDIVVFNPPYVPDEVGQGKKDVLDLAWNGGVDGVESTHPLLEMVGDLLTPNTGYLLLLLEKQNKIPSFLQRYESDFNIEEVISRKVPGEQLHVYKFTRKCG